MRSTSQSAKTCGSAKSTHPEHCPVPGAAAETGTPTGAETRHAARVEGLGETQHADWGTFELSRWNTSAQDHNGVLLTCVRSRLCSRYLLFWRARDLKVRKRAGCFGRTNFDWRRVCCRQCCFCLLLQPLCRFCRNSAGPGACNCGKPLRVPLAQPAWLQP